MTFADDLTADHVEDPVRSLADRRAGHALMTKVLADLGAAALQDVAAQVPASERSWYDGAIGEMIVGHELARLPSSWRVLHSIPIGQKGRDLDHLVIGPGGVFLLNTKRHVDARVSVGTYLTWVRNREEHYQADIRAAAAEVQEKLAATFLTDGRVRPVLVFVQSGPFKRVGEQQVAALQSHQLVDYLRSQPIVLTDEQVVSISRSARRPQTWNAPVDVVNEPDPTVRFLGLRPPEARPVGAPVRTSLSYAQRGGSPRRTTQRVSTRRPASRRPHPLTGSAVFRLLGAFLMIPISIGALELFLQILMTVLRSR